MDDLTGLNWTSSTSGDVKQKLPPMTTSHSYTLRPTPTLSGRSTPLTAQDINPSANGIARSSASTPANDSFANLVSFNASNPSKNLSLQEQQRKLQEERAKQQQEKVGAEFGRQDEEFWEKLGSGRSSPSTVTSPPIYIATEGYRGQKQSKTIIKPFVATDTNQRQSPQPSTNGNDLLAGFDNLNVSQPNGVNGLQTDGGSSEARQLQEQGQSSDSGGHDTDIIDDDDPFGLGSMATGSQPAVSVTQDTTNGDDDVLGLLGRPVSEFSPPPQPPLPIPDKSEAAGTLPGDRALAELVDMGFAPEKSRQALESTESGTDVQAAVGWLLNQAHHESGSKSGSGESESRRQDGPQARKSPPRRRSLTADHAQPAWMRNSAGRVIEQPRQSSRSPVNGEKDPSKIAAELGNNLFKTANSLWKTGTKKLNQAVADLNSDSDSSQPKWMREPRVRDGPARKTQTSQDTESSVQKTLAEAKQPTINLKKDVTDEALMLESGDARPQPRKPPLPKTEGIPNVSRSQPVLPHNQNHQDSVPRPRFMQQSRPQRREEPKSRISKQAIEEQTAEAYISPARRKKTTPKPPAPGPDLLFGSSRLPSTAPTPPTAVQSPPQPTPHQPKQSSQPPRPSPPKRIIPAIPASAVSTSHTSRRAGTAAFKRGDYAQATTHYTSALSPLPSTHPLHIPILTNRALSHLKTGDPKACVADTQTALDLIGPSRGVGETVDLGDDEGKKDMWTYWGKAMTRQAEALEQLEKWAEAGELWKRCVEAGVGGGTSFAGRNRCDRVVRGGVTQSTALAESPALKPKPKPKPKVSSALDDLSATAVSGNSDAVSGNSDAVSRLRLANAAADRLDDEKFALADIVSERVSRWQSGKEGNIRALLASLDTVLWEGSGWKKVGMGELILPGKVKVVYIKGIGKVHPDKLPTTATTEQKMISASVFATLNEAWDGFKRENGL